MKIFGISVHVIEPGATATNFTDSDNMTKAAKEVWNSVPESIKSVYGEDYLQTSKPLSLLDFMKSMCTFIAAFCQKKKKKFSDKSTIIRELLFLFLYRFEIYSASHEIDENLNHTTRN